MLAELDRTDRRILAALQREGRLPNAELAERVTGSIELEDVDVGGVGGTLAANALSLAAMRATPITSPFLAVPCSMSSSVARCTRATNRAGSSWRGAGPTGSWG